MEGEGKIYATLLLKLCDIVAPLVLSLHASIRRPKLFLNSLAHLKTSCRNFFNENLSKSKTFTQI